MQAQAKPAEMELLTPGQAAGAQVGLLPLLLLSVHFAHPTRTLTWFQGGRTDCSSAV